MQKLAIFKVTQSGFTLLEVIIVVAILSAVLIPVSIFFQEYITRSSSSDLLINHQLAKSRMEKVLISRNYVDNNTTIVVDHKSFIVATTSAKTDDMVLITISAKRSEIESKAVVLKRYVYHKEEI